MMGLALVVAWVGVGVSAEPKAPKTLLTTPGKLLFQDDFSGGLGKQWRAAKGSWESADGALKVAEKPEDKHGAVARHAMKFKDVIIEYSFKLDGARATTLSINDAKEHVCRMLVSGGSVAVQKDDHDHDGPDKAVVFQKSMTKVEAGKWHHVVVEIRGTEMLATLDGTTTVFGSHPTLDVEKANFGLTVAGQTVSFKELRAWESLPNPSWEATKAKLSAAKPAAN